MNKRVFLRGVSGKGIQGNEGNFLSSFTGVYLVFEVFQTGVAYLCFLVRVICRGSHVVTLFQRPGFPNILCFLKPLGYLVGVCEANVAKLDLFQLQFPQIGDACE